MPRPSAPEAAEMWERFGRYIEATLGLHFPSERLADLARAMEGVAREFGFDDAAECARWLSTVRLDRARLEVLARHLTIGETYFFRDRRMFDVLAGSVLPELISLRRGRDQRLRLWSAACASGEEAYSLAVLVRELLPDLADWQVTIVATDINSEALRKAVAGTYTAWSFRDTPEDFKERYFTPENGRRYTIRPEIRRMVTFEHLNLIEDVYPTLTTGTNAMDVILCRNALMYLSPPQMHKVARNLHHALTDGGWLVVAASEASHVLFSEFEARNFPGVILYRKRELPRGAAAAGRLRPIESPEVPGKRSRPVPPTVGPVRRSAAPPDRAMREPVWSSRAAATARSLYEEGRYGEAADLLLASVADRGAGPEVFSLLARALSNLGRLAEALTWCDRWIGSAKTDASAHYLRGMVLLERGEADEARRALQRALYLQPELVLGYFALGTLARSGGRTEEAERYFANAMRLLNRLRPEDLLPESDGLTAGRLAETITALRGPRSAA